MKFQSEAEIDQFLAAFEAGTIPKSEWTHQAHLAAAGALVWRDSDSALPLVRFGILQLARVYQIKSSADAGYHETLTVFWVAIVRDFCLTRRTLARLAVINELMRLPSSLYKQYYGFDVVNSRKARERWTEPDLQKLPGDAS